MTQKISSILLIDDDQSTNFLHQIILQEHVGFKNVLIADSGKKALTMIQDFADHQLAMPEIIFLDLNMPGVDGWDFLSEYKQICEEHHIQKSIIYILTTSINPDDFKRAEKIEEVSGFRNKPLTEEMIEEILSCHFAH